MCYRPFGCHSHSWHSRPGSDLDDDQTRPMNVVDPGVEVVFLGRGAVRDPVPVVEHQDIGSGEPAAFRTGRRGTGCTKGLIVNQNLRIPNWPDFLTTRNRALEMVDRTVALEHLFAIESGRLKLTVDVGCEDEATVAALLGPVSKEFESLVGGCSAVEVETMAVESPSERWIA